MTATDGAYPCGFVSVGTYARRVNSVIHTVVLKHKPARGALWQVLAHVCRVSAGEVFNPCNYAVKSFQCSGSVRRSRVTKGPGMKTEQAVVHYKPFAEASPHLHQRPAVIL